MNKVTRIKNANYTTISNVFLRDKELSLKAKGLLATILSLPEDWDFSIKGICATIKEGTTAVYSAIDELKEHEYCKVVTNRNEKGMIVGNDYTFYEDPSMENLNVGNQTQINTNIINTKKQIDKDDKTKISSFFVAEEHNRLTLELIERGYINEDDIQIFYYDKLFNQLLEEDNSYQDLIQIIHYIVPRVVKRGFRDENDNIIENKFGYFKNSIISNIHRLNLDIDDLWGEEDLDSSYNFDDIER